MTLVQEIDYGTPASRSQATVTLEIDGKPVTVPEGTSVMRASVEAGVRVPRLCATDNLEPFGSCRLCLVEIEGRKGTPASCTTPVEAGMKVTTQSGKLGRMRRNVMELYISDHPLDCLTCPANGNCELQDMAGAVGLREVRYGYEGANHLHEEKDESNPYFTFDPSKCIVCSRCVRACEEVQGTFALTIDERGFASHVSPGMNENFLDSECVSCGACVQACPTATLMEKSIIEHGTPERSVITTCAYCGVGCSFEAELQGNEVVRMTPYKDGKANHGHSCVKGRFAWGYATHKERILKPMIRKKITDPWQEVSWDEAINYAASEFKRIQAKYGRGSVGGITSSRCTNEETFLVQKMIRAAFGNNNVDTCARVCHSPTGYGLNTAFGTSAGTQDFDSVMDADVLLICGANPTDAHPVFASRMKRRVREGAKVIVVDPRKIDMVRTPHVEASYHLPLLPGTNVAIVNALAHTILTEGLENKKFIEERVDSADFAAWADFIRRPENSPEAMSKVTGVPASDIRAAARLFAKGPNSAIYYGLGVTEHSQGSTMVMGLTLDPEPGLRIPNMFDAAIDGSFKGLYVQGEDIAQSDPNTHHVQAALSAMECVVVQDLFLCETALYAHVFLPGSSFLEKDGTFTNAERRINRVRKAIPPMPGMADWEVTMALSKALGYPMHYNHPSEIMDEIARLTPGFRNVSYDFLDKVGSVQWPCNDAAPDGSPIMHINGFARGKGKMELTEYVPTDERTGPRFPLILTTGRILSQYNVGAQTRRTENSVWHEEDVLEIHPHDAEHRGIREGDHVAVISRAGETSMKAHISDRMQPGVVYTTFHFPDSGANVVTTENSDWATNCPEYKVTAVEIRPTNRWSNWQEEYSEFKEQALRIGEPKVAAE
jgi:formate dehydrogenase major subunit